MISTQNVHRMKIFLFFIYLKDNVTEAEAKHLFVLSLGGHHVQSWAMLKTEARNSKQIFHMGAGTQICYPPSTGFPEEF